MVIRYESYNFLNARAMYTAFVNEFGMTNVVKISFLLAVSQGLSFFAM